VNVQRLLLNAVNKQLTAIFIFHSVFETAMKVISFIFLLVSIIIIVYFFIKEQFRGIVLSSTENTILSITYLVVGICLIILFRMKNQENKKKEKL
jgi:preprotein translocase subunit YajC